MPLFAHYLPHYPRHYPRPLSSKVIERKLRKHLADGRKPTSSFLVKGLGLFVAADANAADTIENIAMGSMFIRIRAVRWGGVKCLTRREYEFISKWESRSGQEQLDVGDSDGIKNRIAVVTGAGSGLGRSVAVVLARAGAMTSVWDIDVKAAHETVSVIKDEFPRACAAVIGCDVTDESSVERAFDELVDEWGGLDILVNASESSPVYPLMDLPVDKWRLALDVNLTGCFLTSRSAARIMIRQGMGGHIINLSGKADPDASKDNTAYNATKAGELHMARGWAMELEEHGISVNSVCSGIKPEEVVPFCVDKTILKRANGRHGMPDETFCCHDE